MSKKAGKIIPLIEPDLGRLEEKLLVGTIRSRWISEGPLTSQFERMVAEFLKVRYATAVPNGTIALTTACLALGLKSADEVILPDLTMVGSANSVILTQGVPIFVDVNLSDCNINIGEIEKKITKRTRAIMPVHFNGRPADMEKILYIAKKYDLSVVEDAAQAFGSRGKLGYLGTIGDIGCYSFSVPKIVTTGQGGMVVTNNKNLYAKIVQLKDQGRRSKGLDIHDEIGFNFKFNDLQAALGIAQIKKVRQNIERKKRISSLYMSLLKGIPGVRMIETDLDYVCPWFVDIYVPNRNKLAEFLLQQGVKTLVIYPPLHLQPAYKKLRKKDDKFPNTEKISKEGLWLPSSVSLTETEVKRVCRLIKAFFSQ